MTNFFKKMSFSGSPKGTPHDWCRRTMKKKVFCNENQWNWVVFLKKLMNIFTRGPIFYVCSSARNWVSFMYKGIYHICNSLWGVATLDV